MPCESFDQIMKVGFCVVVHQNENVRFFSIWVYRIKLIYGFFHKPANSIKYRIRHSSTDDFAR